MNTEIREKKVSKRLKARRSEMDISQNELARKSGIDRKTINRIENGHFSPSLRTLFILCAAMKTKPSDMLKDI